MGGMANGVARLDAEAVGQMVTTPIPVPAPSRYALLPPPAAVSITTAPLAFDVVDVGYSRSLDWLVVVSASPTPAVLLVNPATGAAETLATPANPSKVFVRADGAVAGVLRSGGVTFLDLPAGTSLREHTTTATRVAFGANGQALLGTDGLSGLQTLSWLDVAAGTTRVAFFAAAADPGTFGTVRDAVLLHHRGPGQRAAAGAARRRRRDRQSHRRAGDVQVRRQHRAQLRPPLLDQRRRRAFDPGLRPRSTRLSRTPAQDLVYAGGLDTIPVVTDAAYAARPTVCSSHRSSCSMARGP